MSQLHDHCPSSDSTPLCCPGPRHFGVAPRRGFLQAGLAGFAALSLPGLLRLRAAASAQAGETVKGRTAVIMVWLPGGMSHIDSYDPKPEAGSEYRGPFNMIPTKVPGLNLTELFPRHAEIADKFTILRSMRSGAGGHPAGSMQLLSGDPDTRDKPAPKYPDWMSVTNYLRSQQAGRTSPLPATVMALVPVLPQ